MTVTTNSNYDTKNALAYKTPVYAIELSDLIFSNGPAGGIDDGTGVDPGEDDLVLYYKFDESSGTTCDDYKESHDGTFTNGPGDDSQWVDGQINNCLKFDGTDDYVDTGHPYKTTFSSSFSISAWYNLDSGIAADQIVCGVQDSVGGSPTDRVIIDIDLGYLGVQYEANNVNVNWRHGEQTHGAGVTGWQHVVAVWDDSEGINQIYVYLNGSLITNVDGGSDGDLSSCTMSDYGKESGADVDLRVGGLLRYNGTTDYIDGYLDDFRIYNAVLTAQNVTWLYKYDGTA